MREMITHRETEAVHVEVLGGFRLSAGGISISDNVNRSRKMWNLLAYIIAHRDKAISQQEFIEMLWPEEESSNPANALKTLLYRIRLLLAPLSEAVGKDLILSQRSSYSWNREVPCIVDAEDFERLCIRAQSSGLEKRERLSEYRRAVELYKGDYLPKLSMEYWAVPVSTYYHSMYLAAVKEFGGLLEHEGLFEEMSKACLQAIAVDNLDEDLHCMVVRSLIKQGKDTAALAHYETATDILYRNLGVRPSQKLRELYQEIMRTQKNLETDLGVIQEQLKEAESVPGAFVCEYGFFKEVYRLEARRAARSGQAVFVGLITMTSASGEIPQLTALNAGMDQLLDAMRMSLRKGDVVARYSGAQFVLLLPALTFEDGEMVMNRIVNNYYKQKHNQLLKLHYKIQQLELAR